ncbi:carbohydrate ABC transporter permease [Pleurocapsa sp. PCC 7319]|uniref:carbohydrate ABC transporter permease n=1 Tax=Pleurocapsa sp. PCC 7319 TaxID=118161 RepID=UPI00034A811F|nr:carbohydrate ABC transporter permease [Pleurocapsa sp. PCC 7319]
MKQRSPIVKATSLTLFSSNFSVAQLLTLTVLILGAIVILFPLIVVLRSSFTSPDSSFTLANYQAAWHRGNFWIAFANSTLVALGVTGLQIITSALAGYALARFKFRGKQGILLLILATLVIPFQLLVIPTFIILKWAHLINSYWALILPTAANGFGIFLMRQYFASIPFELEEAATLDGANRWQVLTRIMLPLSRPALITLFLFTFIGEWNDLFKPLVFTTRPELRTVQLALSEFQEQFTNDWSLLMAAVVISTIPVLILFLIGQKQFIQGIGSTGIKN